MSKELTIQDLEGMGIILEGNKIEIKPYEFNICVIVNNKLETEYGALGAVFGVDSEACAYLVLSDDRIDLPTLVHECMHILDELEKRIGDHLEREARAFIVQEIFQIVLRELGVG